ncbi:MAG: hypothetical protein WBC73_08225 [Phormidesmis sp.]
MTFLKSVPHRVQLIQGSLLALACLGLVFPSISNAQATDASADTGSRRSTNRTILEDGIYLFGQSPTPDQAGTTYAVLSVQNNQTVGAFYQPRSSFDCFFGELQPNRLSVSVVDSYEQTVHPYSIALTSENSVAAGSAAAAYGLDGFHRIETVSATDQEMLAVCQSDVAQRQAQ